MAAAAVPDPPQRHGGGLMGFRAWMESYERGFDTLVKNLVDLFARSSGGGGSTSEQSDSLLIMADYLMDHGDPLGDHIQSMLNTGKSTTPYRKAFLQDLASKGINLFNESKQFGVTSSWIETWINLRKPVDKSRFIPRF
jgi:hypothetical protein